MPGLRRAVAAAEAERPAAPASGAVSASAAHLILQTFHHHPSMQSSSPDRLYVRLSDELAPAPRGIIRALVLMGVGHSHLCRKRYQQLPE